MTSTQVVADRAVLSTWEVFELEPYEDPTSNRVLFAFKTFHGKYLRVGGGDSLSRNQASTPTQEPPAFGPALPEGNNNVISTSDEPTLWDMRSPGDDTSPRVIEVSTTTHYRKQGTALDHHSSSLPSLIRWYPTPQPVRKPPKCVRRPQSGQFTARCVVSTPCVSCVRCDRNTWASKWMGV